jgi:hypothetical protein
MGLRKSYANSYRPSFQFQERQDTAFQAYYQERDAGVAEQLRTLLSWVIRGNCRTSAGA